MTVHIFDCPERGTLVVPEGHQPLLPPIHELHFHLFLAVWVPNGKESMPLAFDKVVLPGLGAVRIPDDPRAVVSLVVEST